MHREPLSPSRNAISQKDFFTFLIKKVEKELVVLSLDLRSIQNEKTSVTSGLFWDNWMNVSCYERFYCFAVPPAFYCMSSCMVLLRDVRINALLYC